eukprot:6306913-Prymnesium_polylepis.3
MGGLPAPAPSLASSLAAPVRYPTIVPCADAIVTRSVVVIVIRAAAAAAAAAAVRAPVHPVMCANVVEV